jgi:hypothetical protein
MPRPALSALTPSEQMQRVRKEIDKLHARLARQKVRGWVLCGAVRGWLQDWEHELNQRGPLEGR